LVWEKKKHGESQGGHVQLRLGEKCRFYLFIWIYRQVGTAPAKLTKLIELHTAQASTLCC